MGLVVLVLKPLCCIWPHWPIRTLFRSFFLLLLSFFSCFHSFILSFFQSFIRYFLSFFFNLSYLSFDVQLFHWSFIPVSPHCPYRESPQRHATPWASEAPWQHAVRQPGDPRGPGGQREGCALPSVGWTDVCKWPKFVVLHEMPWLYTFTHIPFLLQTQRECSHILAKVCSYNNHHT